MLAQTLCPQTRPLLPFLAICCGLGLSPLSEAKVEKSNKKRLESLLIQMHAEMEEMKETITRQNNRIAELEKSPSPPSKRQADKTEIQTKLVTHAEASPVILANGQPPLGQSAGALSSTGDKKAADIIATHEKDKQQNPGDVFKTEPEPGRLGEPARTPGGTTLNFYGFVEMDTIYDGNAMDPAWQSTLRPSKIPVDCANVTPPPPGCGTHAATIMSAKQSRFGLKTLSPTDYGDFKTTFEFDLFGVGANAGQTTFRIRHVFAEFDDFIFGQTWSNFMDVDIWPNIVDYWGPPGMIFQRQPQLRWTPFHRDGITIAAALEAPNAAIDSGKVTETYPSATITPRTPYPDLTSKIRIDRNWGHFQLANVLRGVGYQNIGSWTGNPTEVLFGWGFNASGAFKSFGKDQLLTSLAYGKGVASYFEDGGADGAPQANMNNGQLLPLFGVVAYYDHYWSDQWSSSLGYSRTFQQNALAQKANAFHLGQYASANLLWAPIPKFLTGVELLWGRLQDFNGGTADDHRIQFTARYNYDISFRPGF